MKLTSNLLCKALKLVKCFTYTSKIFSCIKSIVIIKYPTLSKLFFFGFIFPTCAKPLKLTTTSLWGIGMLKEEIIFSWLTTHVPIFFFSYVFMKRLTHKPCLNNFDCNLLQVHFKEARSLSIYWGSWCSGLLRRWVASYAKLDSHQREVCPNLKKLETSRGSSEFPSFFGDVSINLILILSQLMCLQQANIAE